MDDGEKRFQRDGVKGKKAEEDGERIPTYSSISNNSSYHPHPHHHPLIVHQKCNLGRLLWASPALLKSPEAFLHTLCCAHDIWQVGRWKERSKLQCSHKSKERTRSLGCENCCSIQWSMYRHKHNLVRWNVWEETWWSLSSSWKISLFLTVWYTYLHAHTERSGFFVFVVALHFLPAHGVIDRERCMFKNPPTACMAKALDQPNSTHSSSFVWQQRGLQYSRVTKWRESKLCLHAVRARELEYDTKYSSVTWTNFVIDRLIHRSLSPDVDHGQVFLIRRRRNGVQWNRRGKKKPPPPQ